MWTIRSGDFADAATQALLRHHLAGMHANSPPGHVFALDWTGLQATDVTFWTIHEGTALVGCGALRAIDAAHGEIKSMRVLPEHFGRGAGAAMLAHIVAEARARRYHRLSLETGCGPAFEPAVALYRRHGFVDSDAFGGYQHSAFNQLLTLAL